MCLVWVSGDVCLWLCLGGLLFVWVFTLLVFCYLLFYCRWTLLYVLLSLVFNSMVLDIDCLPPLLLKLLY